MAAARWAASRFGLPDQATSKRPSTSTAASAGRAATPTVDRACLPLSPNTWTIRSDAPFMTFGPSPKPAAELMKPPSRITRTTLSRSPMAALTCARRWIAQARDAQQVTGSYEGNVIGDRSRGFRQADAKLLQFLFDRSFGHGYLGKCVAHRAVLYEASSVRSQTRAQAA